MNDTHEGEHALRDRARLEAMNATQAARIQQLEGLLGDVLDLLAEEEDGSPGDEAPTWLRDLRCLAGRIQGAGVGER